ncbi:kinase-like protein, partial [Dentipellis sp. KUC8613]
ILAVEHLHKLKIIHNDIRPANILVDAQGHCRLGDFKSAAFIGDHNRPEGLITSRAPDPLGKEKTDDVAAAPAGDWWSLGVTLAELV